MTGSLTASSPTCRAATRCCSAGPTSRPRPEPLPLPPPGGRRAAAEDVVEHAVPALMENPECIAVLDALDADGDGKCTVGDL
ncbi:hypothetical protein GCM10020229_72090 [Kitasatospora albolonga]